MTFSIDANGILEVKAKDKATGKEHKVSIQAGSGMSEDDIQRMVDEASANAADDERRASLATAKNEAEHHVHQTNKMLDEHQDKLQGDEEDKIKAAIANLETAKEASDASKESIDAAVQQLQTAAQEFGKRIYEASAQEGAAADAAGAASST